MKKTLLALAVTSVYFPSFSSIAADDKTQADDVMVVTANRFEQAQANVITPITVVTRDDIELEQAKSLTDILRNVPGVQIAQLGGRGQASSVFLRGSESGHTLILLNGFKLNSASSGGYDLSQIPAAIIDQVEVIRGPRAAMYGADAIAGVINIITIPDTEDSVHQLFGGIGGDNYSQIGWRSAGRLNDKTTGYIVLNHEHTDGYNVKVGRPADETLGYENKSMTAGLAHQFTETLSGDLQLIYNNGYAEFDSTGVNTTDLNAYQYAGNLTYQNNQLKSVLSVAHSKDDTETSPTWPARYVTLRDSVSWGNSIALNHQWLFNTGIDWNQDSIKGSTSNYTKDSRTNKAAFVSAHGQLNNRFQLDSSLRYDDNSSYGGEVTWNVAASYDVLPSLKAFAAYGTGFKAPTFNDLYAEYGSDPTLKPQNAESAQFGFKGDVAELSWQLVGYHSVVDDMIVWYNAQDPNGAWSVHNTDANIKGVELNLNYDVSNFSQAFSVNYTNAKDDMGNQLARRAEWNANSQSTYFYNEKFNTSLLINYIGKRYSDPSNHIELPSVILLNVVLNYNVTNQLELSAKIDNILDEDYEMADTYRAQGRIGYLNAKYSF
ncbi:TonB-dependent receptor domain-containing protein [Photobacterium leiognathi]|uniref:TonB-dependent receptor domain-containing protein n=1 Tax=Photobacterium leiognathi TaxID=553611 RepID=UPI002980AEEA|nr:TonB-dependent receptor [Photobacterium leiognathi]